MGSLLLIAEFAKGERRFKVNQRKVIFLRFMRRSGFPEHREGERK